MLFLTRNTKPKTENIKWSKKSPKTIKDQPTKFYGAKIQ